MQRISIKKKNAYLTQHRCKKRLKSDASQLEPVKIVLVFQTTVVESCDILLRY